MEVNGEVANFENIFLYNSVLNKFFHPKFVTSPFTSIWLEISINWHTNSPTVCTLECRGGCIHVFGLGGGYWVANLRECRDIREVFCFYIVCCLLSSAPEELSPNFCFTGTAPQAILYALSDACWALPVKQIGWQHHQAWNYITKIDIRLQKVEYDGKIEICHSLKESDVGHA